METSEFFEKSNQILSEVFAEQLQDPEFLVYFNGGLKVNGVNINRSKNKFLHEYLITKTGENLTYEPSRYTLMKEREAQEELENSKDETVRDTYEKSSKKANDNSLWERTGRVLRDGAKILGFGDTSMRDGPPDVSRDIGKGLREMVGQYNNQFMITEDHILILEYEIRSSLRMEFFDVDGGRLTNQEFEKTGSHVLRVEKPVFKCKFLFSNSDSRGWGK
jgi:hypothetical protein